MKIANPWFANTNEDPELLSCTGLTGITLPEMHPTPVVNQHYHCYTFEHWLAGKQQSVKKVWAHSVGEAVGKLSDQNDGVFRLISGELVVF